MCVCCIRSVSVLVFLFLFSVCVIFHFSDVCQKADRWTDIPLLGLGLGLPFSFEIHVVWLVVIVTFTCLLGPPPFHFSFSRLGFLTTTKKK